MGKLSHDPNVVLKERIEMEKKNKAIYDKYSDPDSKKASADYAQGIKNDEATLYDGINHHKAPKPAGTIK